MRVAVIGTGLANTASVLAALGRAGADAALTVSPVDAYDAAAVVVPGVGGFGAGIDALRSAGLLAPLRRRIDERRPTLAICLGLQLLASSSDESPGVTGLGVLDAHVERFRAGRVPHMGWNNVEPGAGSTLVEPGFAYFAHSFRLAGAPPGWSAAWSAHEGAFVAAIEHGPVLACQFHPELSGRWGAALLARWLDAARGDTC